MNKNAFMYISGILTMVFLWGYFIYLPFHKKQELYAIEKTSLENQLNDFKTTLAQLPQYLERKSQLQKERQMLTSKLYTKEEVLNLFSSIRKDASEYNLQVVEITPPVNELLALNRVVPDSTQPQFLTIGIRLDGDYIQFGKYVHEIEDAPYFRGLHKCTITGERENNEKLHLYISFKALLGNFRSS